MLLLSPFVPFPPVDGGRIRIWALLEGLARTHEVDVLSLAEPSREEDDAARELRRRGFDVQVVRHRRRRSLAAARALATRRSLYGTLHLSRAFTQALADRLRSGSYAVVQCEYPYTAQYRRFVGGGGARWVLDEHNLEGQLSVTLADARSGLRALPYRGYTLREAGRRQAEELGACRQMDHVLTVSELDRRVLQAELPDLPVSVIPNGVDLDHFYPPVGDTRSESPGAVFVGKLDYRPNADAVKWFCTEILPVVRTEVPRFTFTIVGAHSGRLERAVGGLPGVRIVGEVRDTRPFLVESTVVVVPLRSGAGTRLKVLEALAMGRPVVSTAIGCRGLDVVDGRHLLVAEAPELFARRIADLLHDPEARHRLGREGRRLIESRYGWPAVVSQLEALYEELVATTLRGSRSAHDTATSAAIGGHV